MSAYSNKRTDEFGGSVENRCRFAAGVIRAIKDVVPPEIILGFRVSNWGIVYTDEPLL